MNCDKKQIILKVKYLMVLQDFNLRLIKHTLKHFMQSFSVKVLLKSCI